MALRLAGFAVILLCSLVARSQSDSILPPHRRATFQRTCQEIKVPMCRGIGYNMAWLPNQFDMESQQEIDEQIQQYYPLVQIRCSSDFLFFICSSYLPLCSPNYQKPLPICRSVCERARLGCLPIISQFGYDWPERLNCWQFPDKDDQDNLCVDSIEAAALASIPQ